MTQTTIQLPPNIRDERPAPGSTEPRLYTARFFLVFAAVFAFMTGVALQFHFGQYIQYLGYGVDVLGRILSISVLGALLIRLHIGRWIDRLGGKPVWVTGALIAATAVGAIQFTGSLWLVTALRTVWMMAMALVMTTVVVIAAQMAPPQRRTESIGILGLAGLTGIMVGPTLGDVIFARGGDSMLAYHVFFSASAACSLISATIVLLLPPPPRIAGAAVMAPTAAVDPGASQLRVIRDHWPGPVLLIGVIFAMVFCVQNTFLERLAEDREFRDIKVFFLTYGPTAIVLRVMFRRFPARFGRTRTVILGAMLFAVGLLCLAGVSAQWQLMLPSVLMGGGHAFIFPSMVDLAAERLPPEHRGTGTALIFAAGDVGMLIGYWWLGEAIDAFGFTASLTLLATLIAAAGAYFAITRRHDVFRRRP